MREAPSLTVPRENTWGSSGKPASHFPSGLLFSLNGGGWVGGGEAVEMFATYSVVDVRVLPGNESDIVAWKALV